MVGTEDQFVGSVLCLALGDALGAPFEGGPLERAVWTVMGRTFEGKRRWTDDTQMSLDLAESLIANRAIEPDDVARRFASSYAWSRGYGPGAAKVLAAIRRGVPWQTANRSVYPSGSYGNGGAMRAAVVGLFFAEAPDELRSAIDAATRITHTHPLAIEGAELIARAAARSLVSAEALDICDYSGSACREQALRERLGQARTWLRDLGDPEPGEVARRLGNGPLAAESCVTALYIGTRFLERPFVELLEFVVQCRGDTDTIGAMAGAIWGAANGAERIPQALLEQLEQRSRIERTGAALYHASRS